jgi:transformer-2 protein
MASMDYENENGSREYGTSLRAHPQHLFQRDRSASPRPTRRNESPRGGPRRSASPNGNGHVDSRSA